ncbi:MAG: GH3 auxin-responsive promoter family protein [Planctomycetes bacterium]|nr:GH3 auxin-responsive promoter family protein [Planctomycetota bacterium]
MSLACWLNSAWMRTCQREARAFRRATHTVAQTQEAVLRNLLAANRDTSFGKLHRFASIASTDDYQRSVRLSTYDAYAPFIEEIAAGRSSVLTADRVELLEPTSGTTSGEKWIPYTASLRAQFQRAIAAWIADVMANCPAVRRGRAYWSISPAVRRPRRTEGGVPIGFDSDAAYLSRWQQLLVRQLLIMPPGVTSLTSIESFRYCSLFHLVAAADLALVSIWSPTFLTVLLSTLEAWSDRICDDLRRGRLSLPDQTAAAAGELRLGLRQRTGRADELRRIFQHSGPLHEKLHQIWPRLALISCWADATAASYLPALQALFPTVAVQPKGLLSTEGCVSFPLWGRCGTALALRSHFFEFREWRGQATEETSGICLAHELEAGRRYEVIVTTGGGLYRYQLHDIIEVTGFENHCPLIRLVGRADRVSDLVGEKLGEPHVQEVLSRVFAAHRLAPRFAMIVPVRGNVPCYRLYLQGHVEQLTAARTEIARDTDEGLRSNPYYHQAVELGQLRPLEVQVLDADFEAVWQVYERVGVAHGRKLGQIKPGVLDSWTGWPAEFSGCSQSEGGEVADGGFEDLGSEISEISDLRSELSDF